MVAMLAPLLLIAQPWAAAREPAVNIDGRFVRYADKKLQMTDKEGQTRSLLVSLDLKVTCDGEESAISSLRAGMKIRVTTFKSDKGVATEIEALDKHQMFANTQDGTLIRLSHGELVMLDINSEDHFYKLSPKAVITLDGISVKPEDLKMGMKLRVTSSAENKSVASRVQAIHKIPEF